MRFSVFQIHKYCQVLLQKCRWCFCCCMMLCVRKSLLMHKNDWGEKSNREAKATLESYRLSWRMLFFSLSKWTWLQATDPGYQKNWMWEGGSQWHLAILDLCLSSWASSHRAKDTTKVSFWGKKKTLLHFLIDKIRNPIGSKQKFRQPKKEQHLSQTRGSGAECGVWLEVQLGLPHAGSIDGTPSEWACARSRFHKSHVFNLILSGSGLVIKYPRYHWNTFGF